MVYDFLYYGFFKLGRLVKKTIQDTLQGLGRKGADEAF